MILTHTVSVDPVHCADSLVSRVNSKMLLLAASGGKLIGFFPAELGTRARIHSLLHCFQGQVLVCVMLAKVCACKMVLKLIQIGVLAT